MLAQLLEIEGVASAEVDHAGLVMRIRCDPPERAAECLAALRSHLTEAGHEMYVLEGAQRQAVLDGVERWYGLESVDGLSQEELARLKERTPPAE